MTCTFSAGQPPAPDVPKEIQIPAGFRLVTKVEAKGVQIYKAVAAKDSVLEWVLEGPLAELSDDKGGKAGHHYEGPAWEATDGSKIVRDTEEPIAAVPAPDPKANIPWLRVKVKSADATPGAFAGVVYVQRVNTTGGKAPADPPKRVGTKMGVPYTATYVLWAKAGQ
jgi:hypothetical protein